MFKAAFSGFSVNDLEVAKRFYQETLGLDVTEETMGDGSPMGITLQLHGGGSVFVYPKEDHQAATYTVLNLVVENIDEAVEDLKSKGVNFEIYEGMGQDEKGIARGLSASLGPDIAWFKDPAGNILSILQDK